MKNTDFMNLSLPEGADKIDVEILNSDFKKLENEASKHYIQQQIGVDGTATIIGSIGPYVQLENLTDNILNVSIGDELVVLMKGDNRKIRTITNANFGIVTSGAVKVTYYVNARTYADENFYKKEKVDELLSNVEATVEVDAELSETSENPVQNKVITAELASYATTAEVERKVTEKVSEIVAGAPERYDTLKELADWIDSHADSAASMNSAIEKNAEDIATANENIKKKLGINDAASKVKSTIAGSGGNRSVFFNDQVSGVVGGNTPICIDADFYYNPNNNTLTVPNIESNTTVALKNDVAINKSTLGTQCKNLLKPTTISQGETKGITITVNDDGTITATGTATETFSINVGTVNLKAGNYILNGCPSGGSNTTYRLDTFYNAASHHHDLGNGVKVNLSSDINVTVRLVIYPAAGEVNLTFAPMIKNVDITDDTYEPYQADMNTRISALEALSDVVYKHNKSSYCTIDGYVLRVGNQVHLNLTATFHTACGEWYGGVIGLPFNTKTPDNSTRYTIKQTQSDGRETSIYLQMGGTSFYSSTKFKKGDIITIPPTILDMYVEETATTEGGE